MSGIKIVILIFSCIGAADYLAGNKLGIGKEFEKAFSLFAPMALSMLGMIVIAPAIGVWLMPAFEGFYRIFKIDPSIIPASLFANDMGGMQLAQTVCVSEDIGNFNAFFRIAFFRTISELVFLFYIKVVCKTHSGNV